MNVEAEIATVKEQVKNLFDWKEAQVENNRITQDLAASTREIAAELKFMKEDMFDMKKDVSEIKNQPAKRWESIVSQMVSIIIAAVAGYFIAKF